MVNVMTGGAVSNIMFFYYESAFSALPVSACSHSWVKGSGLNRLALDLRSGGGYFVAVVRPKSSARDLKKYGRQTGTLI